MFSQYSDLGAFMKSINVLSTEASLENPEFGPRDCKSIN